jgi:hypothetical protein
MLDGVSLDQLRIFIVAADEGSFSAAGRRLSRAQSVVRAPQTRRRTTGKRDDGPILCLEGLGCEAPASV